MDWKAALVLSIAAIILVFGLISSGLVPGSENFKGITGFFTATQESNISIHAVLKPQNFEIDTDSKLVQFSLINPSQITVGENKVDLSAYEKAEIKLMGWEGKIKVADKLELDGHASQIIINGIALKPLEKSKVLIAEEFDSLEISDVEVPKMKFSNTDGYVYVDDGKYTIKIDHEPLEFESFKGSLQLDKALRLYGVVGRLLVSGENRLTVT